MSSSSSRHSSSSSRHSSTSSNNSSASSRHSSASTKNSSLPDCNRYLLPYDSETENTLGDTEEIERYERGGFHPVHLGDRFDCGRYKIIHKLGDGGFSTVWLARDAREQKWVALKIVVADETPSVEAKTVLSHHVASQCSNDTLFITYTRYFHIDGPNGRHLCLVLPVLGPSAKRLSHYMDSRIEPWLARRTGYQTAKALADLHAQNLCHGGKEPTPLRLVCSSWFPADFLQT